MTEFKEINVSVGRTISVNYNSIRPQVSITVTCDDGDHEKSYKIAKDYAFKALKALTKEMIEETK